MVLRFLLAIREGVLVPLFAYLDQKEQDIEVRVSNTVIVTLILILIHHRHAGGSVAAQTEQTRTGTAGGEQHRWHPTRSSATALIIMHIYFNELLYMQYKGACCG